MIKKQLMKIRPSKYVQPIFTQPSYESDAWGGRGRGGSHNLTLHAVFKLFQPVYFRGFFVRAVHNHIRDSLWQDFKDRLEEVSDLNKHNYAKELILREDTMSAVHKRTGNRIKSRGFKSSAKSNTAHLKSIAGATHVYIEEFEEVGQDEYSKLADSLRTTKAPVQILRSWNAPSKDHWFIQEYFNLIESKIDGYYELEPKGLPGHLSVYGTYLDNVKNLDPNTIARYERYKETNPKYYYNQIKGLVSDGGDHKVYYSWKTITYKEFMQIDGYYCYGLDFGDTAPTSLVAIKYKDGRFYRHEVLYESMRSMQVRYKEELEETLGVNYSDGIWSKHDGLLSFVFNLIGVERHVPIFCDPAQAGLIIELREAGFMAEAAKKDKKANINFINRAINYYTEDSVNLEKEYNNYYLETDINKNPIDGKPKKGNDHIMDAQEYACRGAKDDMGIIL